MAELTQIERIDIEKLIPYINNAKIHSDDQIARIAGSIREFGFVNPVLIDRDYNIIAGHGRVAAARKLALKDVPCVYVEGLTDAQRKAYILADNKLGELAEWDMDLVAAELEELQALNFDIDLTGFEMPIIAESPDDVVEDIPPEPPQEPKTKPGQMFRLGRHYLICGDATDPAVVEKLLQGKRVDLLLTDPPYNVDLQNVDRPRSSNNGTGVLNDHMEFDDFVEFLTKALRNASDHMKDGAAYYVWYAGLHHMEFETGIRNVGFKIHTQLIWVKSHFVLGRNSDYQWQHEPCFYGWKPGDHYFTDSRAESSVIEDKAVRLSTLKKNELITLCEKLMGMRDSTTVLRADKPNAADLHPTVKPQELLARQIINSSKRDWIVLDLFGGSGSTLLACEQLGRICYMSELDPHYCDVIIERWENMTGQKAELYD